MLKLKLKICSFKFLSIFQISVTFLNFFQMRFTCLKPGLSEGEFRKVYQNNIADSDSLKHFQAIFMFIKKVTQSDIIMKFFKFQD